MKKFIFILIIIPLFIYNNAFSDGGLIYPPYYEVWESGQLAIVIHNAEQKTESIILHIKFEGNTKNFGWIVPTPTIPTLSADVDNQVFYEASSLTSPIYRERRAGCNSFGCAGSDYATIGVDEKGTEIISQQTVGIYKMIIISSTNSQSLIDTLTNWGYWHNQNSTKIKPIFDYYINKRWYFTAMKIDTTQWKYDSYYGGYWYSSLDPIRFTFSTDTLVYPMKISSFSSRPNTQLILYTIADHKMNFSGSEVQYANNLTNSELEYIRKTYPNFSAFIENQKYITKLRKTFTISEMNKDLEIKRANNDEEYREIYYTGFSLSDGLLIAIVLGLAIRLVGRKIRCGMRDTRYEIRDTRYKMKEIKKLLPFLFFIGLIMVLATYTTSYSEETEDSKSKMSIGISTGLCNFHSDGIEDIYGKSFILGSKFALDFSENTDLTFGINWLSDKGNPYYGTPDFVSSIHSTLNFVSIESAFRGRIIKGKGAFYTGIGIVWILASDEIPTSSGLKKISGNNIGFVIMMGPELRIFSSLYISLETKLQFCTVDLKSETSKYETSLNGTIIPIGFTWKF